jgi:hypothetical protein
MKGIIFNLLEDYVTSCSDEASWEDIVAKCSLESKAPLDIVGPGTYPDNDFLEIVLKAADHLKTNPTELLRQFGRHSTPAIARRYSSFFTPYQHPKDFLKFTGVIHQTEIKKLYKDAKTPQFSCHEIDENHISLKYSSERHLDAMVEGLLEGLGDYYKIPLQIEAKKRNPNSKPASCEFIIKF